MVHTRLTQVAAKPEHKVTQLCLSSSGTFLAWAEQGGHVCLGSLSATHSIEVTSRWSASGTVVGLCTRGERAYALDDVDGLTCLNQDGESVWSVDIPGGGFSLHQGPNDIAVIDALGRLHRVGYDGSFTNLSKRFDGVIKSTFVGIYLVLAHEDGRVQSLKGSEVVWQRTTRGEVGEAITALGADTAGHLVLGREGYALVDGDEEALEMETWCLEGQGLLERSDLSTRLTHCVPGYGGVICGFDDGRVTCYKEGAHRDLLKTNYAVQNILVRGKHVVVSSWFYLFGTTETQDSWKIEHQGMPTLLVGSAEGEVCLFAGEDQNDWTDPEPIGSFSLTADMIETDPSELTTWFADGPVAKTLSAEEIYRVDDSVDKLLTEEERKMLGQPVTHDLEMLQDALGESIQTDLDSEQMGTLNVDSESLLEAMDDAMSNMAMMPDEDLFDALNEQVVAPIAPVPRAGDDRELVCDEDGTCIVVLDGLASEDAQNRIVMWSWVDATGKEIATQPQVKVRLSAGIHRFELRICDSEGRWSSDALQLTLKRA